MAKRRYMVIQLPEWNGWRIAGSDNDWQMQTLVHDKSKDGDYWKGTNFWPELEHAVGAAYERTLRESGGEHESLDELVRECKRVKASLLKAVKAAVA